MQAFSGLGLAQSSYRSSGVCGCRYEQEFFPNKPQFPIPNCAHLYYRNLCILTSSDLLHGKRMRDLEPEADRVLIAQMEEFFGLIRDASANAHRAPFWAAHELATARRLEGARERPSTVIIKQSTKLASPPTVSNTAREFLRIFAFPESSEKLSSLKMSNEELALLGTRPLTRVFEEFVEYLPQRHNDSEMHSSLPWEAQLEVCILSLC